MFLNSYNYISSHVLRLILKEFKRFVFLLFTCFVFQFNEQIPTLNEGKLRNKACIKHTESIKRKSFDGIIEPRENSWLKEKTKKQKKFIELLKGKLCHKHESFIKQFAGRLNSSNLRYHSRNFIVTFEP